MGMMTFKGRHQLITWLLYPLAACLIAWIIGRFHTVGPDAGDRSKRLRAAKSVKVADAWALWQEAQKEPEPLDRLLKGWAAAESMDADQLARAFNEALDANHSENLSVLGELWVSSQPEALVDALLNAPGDASSKHRDILDAAFRAWGRRDSRAAFDRIGTTDRHGQAWHPAFTLVQSLAIRFLSDHPGKLSEVLLEFEGRENARYLGRSPETFSGDVDVLAKSLSELPSTNTRDWLARVLANAILTEKPDIAANARFWQWWQALPPDLQRETLPALDPSYSGSKVYAEGEHLQAPLEARSHLAELAMDDTNMVPAFMQHFGTQWAEENAREALAWVLQCYEGRELTGSYSWSSSGSMFTIGFGEEAGAFHRAVSVPILTLARQDPWQAIEALEDVPFLQTRSLLAQVIAGEWARTEPEAAIAWTQTLPAQEFRQRALCDAMTTWAKQDPDSATSFGLRAGSAEVRQEWISHVGDVLRQGPAVASARWLVSLPDELIRSQLGSFIGQPPDAARVNTFKEGLAEVPSGASNRFILGLIDQRLDEANQ